MENAEKDEHTCLKAALRYLSHGWSVIPIEGTGGRKKSLVRWQEFQRRLATPEEVAGWWAQWPDANVGIVTGAISNLLVVDTDGPAGEAFVASLLNGATTLTSRTGGSFFHRYYNHPGERVASRAGVAAEVDVRGDGGYVVAPPSLHASGNLYAWQSDAGVSELSSVAEMPDVLRNLLLNAATPPKKSVVEGSRNATLAKKAGALFGRGHSAEEVLRLCGEWNMASCSPPLGDEEVSAVVESIGRRDASKKPKTSGPIRAISRCMEDVTAEQIDWLWYGYIPLGKLTLLDGDPGLGKSLVTLDLAARTSRGSSMPDGALGAKGAVILLTAEDGLGDTVKPRLLAMRADLSQIHTFEGLASADGTPVHPTIPESVADIERVVRQQNAVLVVIDPLSAFLSAGVNSWSDQQVRAALCPLTEMARTTGAGVLVVRHLNKRVGGSALHRGGGSIGLIGAARSGLLIAPSPDSTEQRIMAQVKSNLGKLSPSMAFHVEAEPSVGPWIVWDGTSDLGADALLTPPDVQPRGKVAQAEAFLMDALANGERTADSIEADARAVGIAPRTLERARAALSVVATRVGGYGAAGQSMLRLPSSGEHQVGEEGNKNLAEDDKDQSASPPPLVGSEDTSHTPPFRFRPTVMVQADGGTNGEATNAA